MRARACCKPVGAFRNDCVSPPRDRTRRTYLVRVDELAIVAALSRVHFHLELKLRWEGGLTQRPAALSSGYRDLPGLAGADTFTSTFLVELALPPEN